MILQAIYAAFCVLLAWDNARIIKKGIVPMHWLNGCLHITAAVLAGIFKSWWLTLPMLITARIAFNTALNLFRGLPVFYVTPEKRPKSWVDRMEKLIFGMNGEKAFWFYFAAWTVSNVLYLIVK